MPSRQERGHIRNGFPVKHLLRQRGFQILDFSRSGGAKPGCRPAVDAGSDRSGDSAEGARHPLVQVAYHNRSLCLYTRLGFRTREPLSLMQGPPLKTGFAGCDVRAAERADLDACNALCRDIHGVDRGGELQEAIDQQTATVVERLGRITGYATDVDFFAHAVGRTNLDLMALIAAAPAFSGPGFLLSTRNQELFAWCLGSGLRLAQQMTLMTIGLYNEPDGAYLPSILY